MRFAALTTVLLVGCVAPATQGPRRWSDLGFQAPAQRVLQTQKTELDRSTDSLLNAIEASTGERPVFDGDSFDLAPLPVVAAEPGRSWITERRVVAMDILRDLDGASHDRAGLQRARAALQWDVALDTDWSEVDARMVQDALHRASALLDPPRPAASELIVIESSASFAWPLRPVRITSAFGARVDPFGEGVKKHAGLDLYGVTGQPVSCAAPGVVVYAGNRGAYGLHVEVRHRYGLLTRYAHLSVASVRPGDRISAGSVIGLVGQTGRATGPHLHFEIWRDGLPVDPQVALPEPDVTESGTLPVATR